MRVNKFPPTTGEKLSRESKIDQESINEESRTIEIAFSSETAVSRYFGDEILDHKRESVRLGRVNDGGAVLVDHDGRDHVGVIEEARIDDDNVGRAKIRFGRSGRANEIFDDVLDGIRTKISVGYTVHEWDVTERKGKPSIARATDWEPHEISFVALPADSSVGVGRNLDHKIIEEVNPEMDTENTKAKEIIDVAASNARATTEERTRINDITREADQHDLADLGQTAINEGHSLANFRAAAMSAIGERNNKIRIENPVSDNVGLSDKERGQFSIVRAMNAIHASVLDPHNSKRLQNAAAFEMEVSEAATKQIGIEARGVYIPSDITLGQRDLSAGTDTSIVGSNLLAGSFIDVLRNQSVIMQAGAKTITGLKGNVDIPRKATAPAAVWLSAEDADATEDEATFNQVSMTPNDLASFTEVTRRLLQQSTPGIEAIVRDDLVQSMRLGIDLAGLYGAGVAGAPAGVASTSGINSTTFAATQPTWIELVDMIKETQLDNADLGATKFITDPNGWASCNTVLKAAGTDFIWDANNTIAGRGALVTNQVTEGDWFYGNWADLLIGMWGGLELNVDPYTHSLKGKVRYVVYQTIDLAVRHAVSFCRSNSGSVA